jgi:hypothetical protein
MDITPPLAIRPQVLGVAELSENWAAWGYQKNHHHLILVAFFESWGIVRRPSSADPITHA